MALQQNSRIGEWANVVDKLLREQNLSLYDATGSIVLPEMAGGSWLTSSMIIVAQIPDARVKYIRVWPISINCTSQLPNPATFVSRVMQGFAERSKLIKEGDIIPTGTKIEEVVQ